MPNELKPCPFCGGEANIKTLSNSYSGGEFRTTFKVYCEKCDISFKGDSVFKIRNGYPEIIEDGYLAIKEKWNRRVDNA